MALVAVCFAPAHLQRKATRAIAGLYIATIAALALGYPTVRRPLLANVYAVAFAASVLALLAGLISWRARRAPPRHEHAVTLMLALLDAALFAGPFLPTMPDPFKEWATAQAVYLLLWSTVILMEGGSLWWGWWQSK